MHYESMNMNAPQAMNQMTMPINESMNKLG